MQLYPTLDFCRTPSSFLPAVSEIRKGGTSARAHVQIYPTHDLFNPRPGGGLSHLRPGGGVVKMTTLCNSKTIRDREAQKKAYSIALSEYDRKCFSHFFAHANIEVTRGHQRSILAKRHFIFPEICHYLRAYYRYQAAEKSTR